MSGFSFVVPDGCEYCGLSYSGDTCGHAGRIVEPQLFLSIDAQDMVEVESVAGYHWDVLDEMAEEIEYPVEQYAWLGPSSMVDSMMKGPLYDSVKDIPPMQYAHDRDDEGGMLIWNKGERLKRIYDEDDA